MVYFHFYNMIPGVAGVPRGPRRLYEAVDTTPGFVFGGDTMEIKDSEFTDHELKFIKKFGQGEWEEPIKLLVKFHKAGGDAHAMVEEGLRKLRAGEVD